MLWKDVHMRIIQVPMAEQDAEELTIRARALQLSRADLIRRACRAYLDELKQAELEARYEEGYRRCPEELKVASASALLAGSVPAEEW